MKLVTAYWVNLYQLSTVQYSEQVETLILSLISIFVRTNQTLQSSFLFSTSQKPPAFTQLITAVTERHVYALIFSRALQWPELHNSFWLKETIFHLNLKYRNDERKLFCYPPISLY